MAERRMFAKTVLCSDRYFRLPFGAQALYLQLAMAADDDGFVRNPRAILKMMGVHERMLKQLRRYGYIIPFESGVVALTHWKMNNYIRTDRYKPTVFIKERAMLNVSEDGNYQLKNTVLSPPAAEMPQSEDSYPF